MDMYPANMPQLRADAEYVHVDVQVPVELPPMTAAEVLAKRHATRMRLCHTPNSEGILKVNLGCTCNMCRSVLDPTGAIEASVNRGEGLPPDCMEAKLAAEGVYEIVVQLPEDDNAEIKVVSWTTAGIVGPLHQK